jgi:DNA topoisomerase I
MMLVETTGRIADPEIAAGAAGLRYVHAERDKGISRRRSGKRFVYRHADGKPVKDEATLARIRKLAIPPAWTDVWICPHPDGHLQATGFDARGRKQYRYNDDFRRLRETAKFEHILIFARTLPDIRGRIARDMARHGLPREKVLATVVHLLETTMVRVGNKDYAKANHSYGLTTLKNPHVAVRGGDLRFHFKGKSGKTWNLKIHDRRVARIVRACQELPGQQLFEYRDAEGGVHSITSTDVNTYLKDLTGRDITAKDFRTWSGTVAAAVLLYKSKGGGTKGPLKEAIEHVSERLGNTPTICRKCYIHPEVIDAYAHGKLVLRIGRAGGKNALNAEEAAVYRFLVGRLR